MRAFRYTAFGSAESRGTKLLHVDRSGAPQVAVSQSASGIARYQPYALAILRIVAGLLFFEHGTSRLFGFPSPLPTPALFSLYWFAGSIEFVGGALIGLGLFTRTAALIVSGEMAFAYFLSHAPASVFPILNRGDGAILYCFVFFFLVFAGAGPWSLDAAWSRKRG